MYTGYAKYQHVTVSFSIPGNFANSGRIGDVKHKGIKYESIFYALHTSPEGDAGLI